MSIHRDHVGLLAGLLILVFAVAISIFLVASGPREDNSGPKVADGEHSGSDPSDNQPDRRRKTSGPIIVSPFDSKDGSVVVEVLREDGSPVPEAEITLLPVISRDGTESWEAQSNSAGIAVLRDVPAGDWLARAKGRSLMQRGWMTRLSHDGKYTKVVLMVGGYRLEGRVGVPGAINNEAKIIAVDVSSREAPSSSIDLSSTYETRSDEDGDFVLENLPVGVYGIYALRPGYFMPGGPRDVSIPAEGPLSFDMTPLLVASVRFRDREGVTLTPPQIETTLQSQEFLSTSSLHYGRGIDDLGLIREVAWGKRFVAFPRRPTSVVGEHGIAIDISLDLKMGIQLTRSLRFRRWTPNAEEPSNEWAVDFPAEWAALTISTQGEEGAQGLVVIERESGEFMAAFRPVDGHVRWRIPPGRYRVSRTGQKTIGDKVLVVQPRGSQTVNLLTAPLAELIVEAVTPFEDPLASFFLKIRGLSGDGLGAEVGWHKVWPGQKASYRLPDGQYEVWVRCPPAFPESQKVTVVLKNGQRSDARVRLR